MSSLTGDLEHPAFTAVRAIGLDLDDLADANLWAMPAGRLAALIVETEQKSRRLDAAKVALAAQAEASQVAEHEGATSTAAWLRAAADVPIGEGKARLKLHAALGRRPITAAAFAAGNVSMDAATAICVALEGLPAAVPAAREAEIERLLVDVARADGTTAVMRTAADIVHRFAPEQLEDDEEKQLEKRTLRLASRHDGSLAIHGCIDREAAALVLAVLSPLAAPSPSNEGVPDLRDAGRRYADAFIQLCQLGSGQLTDVRGERPQLVVTIGHDALLGLLGQAPGLLETGASLSAPAARRIACDARIIPMVLGAKGEPLDVGRSSYVVPQPMRRALIARDRGCVFPGCDRPPSWCDAHHDRHWVDGGPTALCNLALLCDRHHRAVHHDGWQIQLIDEMPWFVPPAWVDPTRKPRAQQQVRRLRTRALRNGLWIVGLWIVLTAMSRIRPGFSHDKQRSRSNGVARSGRHHGRPNDSRVRLVHRVRHGRARRTGHVDRLHDRPLRNGSSRARRPGARA